MKIKLVFTMLLFSIVVNAQLEGLYNYKTNKFDNELAIFKIDGKKYKTDFKKIFLTVNKNIFENKTDDIVHFMIYNKKYLFIGYFPNSPEHQMSSIGYEIKSLHRMDVIDLKNPSNKWNYNFNGKTAMGLISSFNPKNGDLVYCNHIKPNEKGE